MGITGGLAHTITNRVTFPDTSLYHTLLIWATSKLLALHLRKKNVKNMVSVKVKTSHTKWFS